MFISFALSKLQRQNPLRYHHRHRYRQHGKYRRGADGEGGVARVESVAFRHHRNRACRGKRCGGGDEDCVYLKPLYGNEDKDKLGKQTDKQGEDQELYGIVIVKLPGKKYLFRALSCDKRARDEHRDGCAEVGEILKRAGDEFGQLKSHGGGFQHKEDKADKAGDRAEIDEGFFEGKLDVVSSASHNNKSPGPEQDIEAYTEEGRHKLTLARQKRLEDGETDKGAVGEHKSELG